jgi:hypothetical protein
LLTIACKLWWNNRRRQYRLARIVFIPIIGLGIQLEGWDIGRPRVVGSCFPILTTSACSISEIRETRQIYLDVLQW